MSEGFFSLSTISSKAPPPLLPRCGACGLWKSCKSPKMKWSGKGKKKILLVGEAPGCIAGDSLIDTAYRDKTKYPDGIPIKELVGKKDFYVYSFSVSKQKLVLGKVKKVWKTGKKKVYRVTYEWKHAIKGGKETHQNSIVVTSNHKFLLKKHTKHDPYKGIQEDVNYLSIDQGLTSGHSIQPFLRGIQFGY